MPERHIAVVPDVSTDEDNLAGAQELAWGHAIAISSLRGEEVGSDPFIFSYEDYLAKYTMCVDHIGFLQHVSLGAIREVLDERVALLIPPGATDDDIADVVSDLAHIVLSALMWAFASFPQDWLPNEEWNVLPVEARSVTFPFSLPNNPTEEKDDSND